MKVFKFGGASVKDAESVKNVAKILNLYKKDNLLVVVSAMGKMTNLLEKLIDAYWLEQTTEKHFNDIKRFHVDIANDLNISDNSNLESFFNLLQLKLSSKKSDNLNYEYDQIICYGELLSTSIISEYLKQENINAHWIDARDVIKTNSKWREAKIDWNKTETKYNEIVKPLFEDYSIIVSQGFIGGSDNGLSTSLGREGSDFSAGIFAYTGDAENVTIWKDVPGMLNADPRIFSGTVLLKQISFKEAIELAYYGASVIHPKTIQPLKNKEIPLFNKSFLKPLNDGTMIQSSMVYDSKVPSFIFKGDQVLLSLTPKDFSFIIEDDLTNIFSVLSKHNIRVNLMQNSALSFSILVDNKVNINEILDLFKSEYHVKYNDDVELLTVRHYNDNTLARLTKGKNTILEQKTRQTARLVLK